MQFCFYLSVSSSNIGILHHLTTTSVMLIVVCLKIQNLLDYRRVPTAKQNNALRNGFPRDCSKQENVLRLQQCNTKYNLQFVFYVKIRVTSYSLSLLYPTSLHFHMMQIKMYDFKLTSLRMTLDRTMIDSFVNIVRYKLQRKIFQIQLGGQTKFM
jgi:hypothetical protein